MQKEIKSIVKVNQDTDPELHETLTEIARAKGFVWDGQVRNREVRAKKLFEYLIETHPEVQTALEAVNVRAGIEAEENEIHLTEIEQRDRDLRINQKEAGGSSSVRRLLNQYTRRLLNQ